MRKTVVFCLIVRGVFGRNRKDKFESIDLLEVSESEAPAVTVDSLLKLAHVEVTKLRCKDGCKIRIDSHPVEYQTYGDSEIKTVLLSTLTDPALWQGFVSAGLLCAS